jgi:hypothetical protein
MNTIGTSRGPVDNRHISSTIGTVPLFISVIHSRKELFSNSTAFVLRGTCAISEVLANPI